MSHRDEAIEIIEKERRYNPTPENRIAIAKVYAILDLAEAIRTKK